MATVRVTLFRWKLMHRTSSLKVGPTMLTVVGHPSAELDVFDETGLQIDTRKLEQLQLNDKQRQLLLKIAEVSQQSASAFRRLPHQKRRKLESNREMLETAQMEAGGGGGGPSECCRSGLVEP